MQKITIQEYIVVHHQMQILQAFEFMFLKVNIWIDWNNWINIMFLFKLGENPEAMYSNTSLYKSSLLFNLLVYILNWCLFKSFN